MSANLRKVFIGGNWKSNGNKAFINGFIPNVLNTLKFDGNKCEVVISPSLLHMSLVKSIVSDHIQLSAQNVSQYAPGAYTGEVNSIMLKDLGFNWTLTGHSERRQYFGETSEVVAIKTKSALDNGLSVIVCIGENLSERRDNKTLDVCISQLFPIQKHISNLESWRNIVIAYEPIWAIGTGQTATPEQAQEVHFNLRNWLRNNLSKEVADETRIIYGGSVTEDNAKDLILKEDIDGFLVGGASLKPGFRTIVESHSLKF